MKTSQHTPGPWRITNKASFGDPVGICSSDGMHITDVCGYGTLNAPNSANARLIAAAPELLAALEKALESIEGQAELLRHCGAAYGIGATLAQARAAIARATIAKATGGALNSDLSPQ